MRQTQIIILLRQGVCDFWFESALTSIQLTRRNGLSHTAPSIERIIFSDSTIHPNLRPNDFGPYGAFDSLSSSALIEVYGTEELSFVRFSGNTARHFIRVNETRGRRFPIKVGHCWWWRDLSTVCPVISSMPWGEYFCSRDTLPRNCTKFRQLIWCQ